mmetsp:Transcript_14198/g.25410  ORF Transcript_14198/g.25410 Transcript_14198/m.25410 type:complete len:140 (+) Transcript_14198:855-1274(+)
MRISQETAHCIVVLTLVFQWSNKLQKGVTERHDDVFQTKMSQFRVGVHRKGLQHLPSSLLGLSDISGGNDYLSNSRHVCSICQRSCFPCGTADLREITEAPRRSRHALTSLTRALPFQLFVRLPAPPCLAQNNYPNNPL